MVSLGAAVADHLCRLPGLRTAFSRLGKTSVGSCARGVGRGPDAGVPCRVRFAFGSMVAWLAGDAEREAVVVCDDREGDGGESFSPESSHLRGDGRRLACGAALPTGQGAGVARRR